jgi:hypothetical protein
MPGDKEKEVLPWVLNDVMRWTTFIFGTGIIKTHRAYER